MIELYFDNRILLHFYCRHLIFHLAPDPIGMKWGDEEKGYRKFGGCPFVLSQCVYIDKYEGDFKTKTI